MITRAEAKLQSMPSWFWHFSSSFLVAQLVKNPPAVQETPIQSLGFKVPLGMDRLPTPVFVGFWGNGNLLQCSCLENHRDGEPGGMPSMGSHRSGHDWSDLAAAAEAFGSDSKESACNVGEMGLIPGSGRSPGGRHHNPLQYSCLENPMDRGDWGATVRGVAKRGTRQSR